MRAPERRADTRDRAAQRGEANGRAAAVQGGAYASTLSGNASGAERRAVPAYSRPREGRQPIGTAGERIGPPPDHNGDHGYYYNPSYYYPYYYGSPYGFGAYYSYGYPYYGYGYGYPYGAYGYGPWFPGYGFGLGYFYDPFMFSGGYSPYDSYGSGGYGQGSSGGYSHSGQTGQLRLKVKPENGQVYVDGYYVGEVDSFDGTFQRLPIEAGSHRVEIRAAGYQTVVFDVMVAAGETVTYKGELKHVK